MQGAYGGLIIVIGYGGSSIAAGDYFLYLDNTPFGLLNGQNLTLL